MEYASSSAPDADIVEASCSDVFGVRTSLQNLVEDGTDAAILSISYGGPEQDDGLTFLAGWENLVEEGAAEGLSISSRLATAAAPQATKTARLGSASTACPPRLTTSL